VSDFILYITTSLALVLVIEGLTYALFPDIVRKIMAMAVMMPVPQLRLFGSVLVISGFAIVWFLQFFVHG
jgi:uncharacterized protein